MSGLIWCMEILARGRSRKEKVGPELPPFVPASFSGGNPEMAPGAVETGMGRDRSKYRKIGVRDLGKPHPTPSGQPLKKKNPLTP